MSTDKSLPYPQSGTDSFQPIAKTVWREFRRYFLVGGLAFLVDGAVLAGMVELLGVHYLVGATAGFIVGAFVNYWLSVHWVFSERALSNQGLELGLFILIGLIGLGLNDVLMWLFTDWIGLYYLLSKIMSAALVFIYNFVVRRLLLFTARRSAMGRPGAQEASENP